VANFSDAARRGLPVFADGFSMLVSRLREYSHDNGPPGVSSKALAEVTREAKRLIPLSPTIDFARVTLAIHGANLDDPLGSSRPISPRVGAEGWSRYSPETATVDDGMK
jgi:hypothetical protein